MSNDFNYQKLYPFKWFVLQNFPFIEEDFDAITNYQLFCKLGEEINKLINSENTLGKQVEDLTNYFNNLDVQEEINKKLDEMAESGELQRYLIDYLQPYFDLQIAEIEAFKNQITNEVNTFETNVNEDVTNQNQIISNFQNSVNETINTQNEKIDNIVSGTPAGVYATVTDLEEADPDHSKIYVVTATGKWYYYASSQWNEGGTYQATEIADGTIEYKMLNTELKNIVDSGVLNQKQKYFVSGKYFNLTSHAETSASGWNMIKLPLSATKGYVLSMNDTSSRNILGQFYNTTSEEYLNMNFANNNLTYVADRSIVLIDKYNLNKFYMIIPKTTDYNYYYLNVTKPTAAAYDVDVEVYDLDEFLRENSIRKVENLPAVPINYKNRNLLLDSLRIKGYIYIHPNEQYPWGSIISGKDNNYRADILPVETGKTYHIYTDETDAIACYSYDSMIRNPARITPFEAVILNNKLFYHKSITVTTEKYIAINQKLTTGTYNVIITNEAINTYSINEINETRVTNKSSIKNWFCLGDSITNKNYRALVNYIDYVVNDLNINAKNLGVSGAGYNWGTHRFSEQISGITDYTLDDVITVMGSVNDINHLSGMTIGEIGDTGSDTLYGVMYQFYTSLFSTYLGARVGIIEPIPAKSTFTNESAWNTYNTALEETAKLFNIPILKLTFETNLRPNESDFITEFYTADGIGNASQVDEDGIHPNSNGHKLFYGRIKEFIQKL